MGPPCHPLCIIKLSFLGFFLAHHIWSLAFFFRSPAASQTVIPLLLNGTRMSSSMYYKTFFFWVFFGTSYSVTCLFLSIPCRLSNGDTAAAKWDPHVILYVNHVSFLELFLAPDIWSLAFFFRSHATFETLRNLLAHGTRMSSSMYYKSLFSLFFFTP